MEDEMCLLTYCLPLLGVVLGGVAYLLDLVGFFELLLGGGDQLGRRRLHELHRVVGHLGRGALRTRRYHLRRTEIL